MYAKAAGFYAAVLTGRITGLARPSVRPSVRVSVPSGCLLENKEAWKNVPSVEVIGVPILVSEVKG